MTSPESALEKKVVETAETEAEVLTLEERVGRLEIVIERAFNALAKNIQENEMRSTDARAHLEGELTKTLTLMNLGTLQNVVTLKEVIAELVEKNLVSKEELETKVNAALTIAVQQQQAAMQEMMNQQEAAHVAAVAETAPTA